VLSKLDLNPDEKEAFTILTGWDGDMKAEKPAPMIFKQFYHPDYFNRDKVESYGV